MEFSNNFIEDKIIETENEVDSKLLNEKMDKDDISLLRENNNINIFRYKFTEDFTNELYKFSKIHQYDHRNDFKEAWNIWTEENEDLVDDEIRRLSNLGYDGDILDKMFKSARYYFRKKSTEKKEPQKRRVYVGVQKELLESMDKHITNNINDKEYKPSEGFTIFCKENTETLQKEVSRLCKCGLTDHIEIKNKIKKTYKNRYFMLVKK
jgi:hypothetical protein